MWYSRAISFVTAKFPFFFSRSKHAKRETRKQERILNAILSVIRNAIYRGLRGKREREREGDSDREEEEKEKKKKTCRILHASCIKSRTRARSLNNKSENNKRLVIPVLGRGVNGRENLVTLSRQ